MRPGHDHEQFTSASNVRWICHDMLGFADQGIERYLQCVSKLPGLPGSRGRRSSSPKPRTTKLRSKAPDDKPASRPSASVAKPTPDAPDFTYDALPRADALGFEDTSFTDRGYDDAGVLGPDAAS
eukprot:7789873-Pyramimonas_sp.AAC.1